MKKEYVLGIGPKVAGGEGAKIGGCEIRDGKANGRGCFHGR